MIQKAFRDDAMNAAQIKMQHKHFKVTARSSVVLGWEGGVHHKYAPPGQTITKEYYLNVLHQMRDTILLPKGTHGVRGRAHILLPKQATSPGDFLSLWVLCLPPGVRNCGSQCQCLVKRKATIYSKVMWIKSNGRMSPLKIPKSLKRPTNPHSPSFPSLPSQASLGTCQSEVWPSRRKRTELRSLLPRFLPVIHAQQGRSPAVPSPVSCDATISSP